MRTDTRSSNTVLKITGVQTNSLTHAGDQTIELLGIPGNSDFGCHEEADNLARVGAAIFGDMNILLTDEENYPIEGEKE